MAPSPPSWQCELFAHRPPCPNECERHSSEHSIGGGADGGAVATATAARVTAAAAMAGTAETAAAACTPAGRSRRSRYPQVALGADFKEKREHTQVVFFSHKMGLSQRSQSRLGEPERLQQAKAKCGD